MRIILKPLGAVTVLFAVIALIVIAYNANQVAQKAIRRLKEPQTVRATPPVISPEARQLADAATKGGTETVFDGKRKAVPATQFVESVGIGVHWGYADTPYGLQYAAVRDKLLESGIRHMRTGIMSPVEPGRIVELARRGVHSLVVSGPEMGTLKTPLKW